MRDNQIFIIAEAGDNHNGNFDLALQLVDKAAEAGADCVKFQTFVTENVISKFAEKADYQKQTTGENESQYEMVKKLELSFEQFRLIQKYCQEKNIMFLSTPFDLDSIDFLEEIQIPFWKISSGEITNLPYLEKIAKTGKDIIMSTGMCTMEEIEAALSVLREHGVGKITLLHCNTEYPTPDCDVNILAIQDLQKNFPGVSIGFSDHSVGHVAAVGAVILGISMIEKHFTLDKNFPGPDHKASATPKELKALVEDVRRIEIMSGSFKKTVTESEKKNKIVARKSIVAKRTIQAGETFTVENITCKRPGNGISPMDWYHVLGKTAENDFEEDELITLTGFEWQNG